MSGMSHGALMDQVYRRQRHIYDLTRKYYLLGRDRLIADLAPGPGQAVLEIGVGTGRNLVKAAERYPNTPFYGIDISREMLETAGQKIGRHGLADRVRIAEADATDFAPYALFGQETFARVYFSYTLSMIPDWRAALDQALRITAHDGRLLIADFGQQEGLPRWTRSVLRWWLSLFHVDPQADLVTGAREIVARHGNRSLTFTPRYRGYCWAIEIGPVQG